MGRPGQLHSATLSMPLHFHPMQVVIDYPYPRPSSTCTYHVLPESWAASGWRSRFYRLAMGTHGYYRIAIHSSHTIACSLDVL